MTTVKWIGVDLDGTLAYYDRWRGVNHIGKPIPEMLKKVKKWIEDGETVKIFTARVSMSDGISPVKKWLQENDLGDLEVTNIKDFGMTLLYDDKCRQVEKNTGRIING